jgi:hypothetical protein
MIRVFAFAACAAASAAAAAAIFAAASWSPILIFSGLYAASGYGLYLVGRVDGASRRDQEWIAARAPELQPLRAEGAPPLRPNSDRHVSLNIDNPHLPAVLAPALDGDIHAAERVARHLGRELWPLFALRVPPRFAAADTREAMEARQRSFWEMTAAEAREDP